MRVEPNTFLPDENIRALYMAVEDLKERELSNRKGYAK